MLYKIINLASAFFMVVMTAVMLFTFRKPRRITFLSSIFSALMSIIMPVIFLLISGVKPDLRLALPVFGFGLLLGFIRGLILKLEFVGDQVVGKHSIIFLLLWGLSLALNQALSTPNLTALMAVGLAALFLSTGTQVGFYGIITVRRLALLPPEADEGKFSNKAFQRMVIFAFGGLLLIFLVESLLISIPALPFLSRAGASPQVSGEESSFSAPEVETETQGEENPATLEPYFNGEQILVWTRPLAAAFTESENILYGFSTDGSSVSKVYDQPVSAVDVPSPFLSPDGNLWVVRSNRTGEYEQHLMTADGSRTYQLLYQNSPVKIIDWSPDFSQLLVQAQPSGSWDVLITDREGQDWQVVANQAADEIEPRWSPDGKSILYQSNEFGNQDIYLINLNGGIAYNLTRDPGKDQRASWALNGARIVFTSSRDGVFGLYQMDPEGNNVQQIAQDPSCGFKYHLSPDSEHLIYRTDPEYDVIPGEPSNMDCRGTTIFLFSLSSGKGIRLDDAVTRAYGEIWSPDSSKFIYTGNFDPDGGSSDLFVYHMDGSGVSNLSTPDIDYFTWTWSSDSNQVAQVSSKIQDDGYTKYIITIIDANGENWQELAVIPWERDISFGFAGLFWP